MKHDPVNHPKHYTSKPVECIVVSEHLGFCLGNAYKYLYRREQKGAEVQDLEKALWYVQRHLTNPGYVPNVPNEIFPAVRAIAASETNPVIAKLLENIPSLASLNADFVARRQLATTILDDLQSVINSLKN